MTRASLEREVVAIKERNARVERDKAWETSWQRRIAVAIFTYFVVAILFLTMRLPEPYLNALIPASAFVISTLSLSYFKKAWTKE